jgi:DNA-directed RNA polymerase subunit RPC12/RpoP
MYVMSQRYSIDIYRKDDAILIHDKPGGWKRALPGLILSLIPVYLMVLVCIGIYFDPPQPNAAPPAEQPMGWDDVGLIIFGIFVLAPIFGFMLFSFAYIFLYSLWRIGGHETFVINRDSIRRDWWCFWGCRSRIYPRPETIITTIVPGSFFTGGSFGARFRIGKRWYQATDAHLTSASERKWLFDELARFQKEVPVTQPIDEKRRTQKGSLTDLDSGMNILQDPEWHGFRRVVPKSESAVEEETEHGEPGMLALRCAKCHKIIPRAHVLPDKPLAKCPDCGFVFEPLEMKRHNLCHSRESGNLAVRHPRESRGLVSCVKISRLDPRFRGGDGRSRLRIKRTADTLEITQSPLRTGLPLWSIITFLLFDLGMVAFYLYMKQLLPEEDFLALLQDRGENGNAIELWWHFLTVLVGFHVFCLALPLWAFFDRRTIRLDREKLVITGLWFIVPWWKTVSRLQVKKAWYGVFGALSLKDLPITLHNVQLDYGNRSIWIGCSSPSEFEMLRGEINHFLYTNEPRMSDKINEPRMLKSGDREKALPTPRSLTFAARCFYNNAPFIGGTESFDPEVALHCPDCGAKLTAESLDFHTGTAHCELCTADFPVEHIASYRIEPTAETQTDTPPEFITVEKTDDSLTMRYVSQHSKMFLYGAWAASDFFLLFLAGVMGWLIIIKILEGSIIGAIFFTLYFGTMYMIPYFLLTDAKNTLFCDWTIHLAPDEVRLELRCKKRRKTIVIPREKIIEARRNEQMELWHMVRVGHFPDFLWSRKPFGSHLLLDDGTKHHLPLGTVDTRKGRDVTAWMLATINGYLAGTPQ